MKYKFEESFTQALALDTVVYEGMFFESPNVWDKKLEEALDFSIWVCGPWTHNWVADPLVFGVLKYLEEFPEG